MCWFGLTVASADESVMSAALVVKSLGRQRWLAIGSSLSTARAKKTAAALSGVFLLRVDSKCLLPDSGS